MPSLHIHLSIAEEYLKNNKNINKEEFIKGTIYPDMVPNKVLTHYGIKETEDLEYNLKNKVNLDLFLKNNKINSDFNKGYYLHLITDYIFFNYYFDHEYLSNIDPLDFLSDLYYSYNLMNKELEKKYNLNICLKEVNDFINNKTRKDLKKENRTINVPLDKTIKLIEYCSKIDIDNFKKEDVRYNA